MKNIFQNKKGVVFDLDNTLYDETEYFTLVINEFCLKHNFLFNRDLIDLYKRIRPYSKDLFKDLLYGMDVYSDEFKEDLFYIYTSIDQGTICIDDIALNFILKLKQQNVKVALLTNGLLKAQKNKVRLLKVDGYFDQIVYAREFGRDFEKPNPKAFEIVTERLKEEFTSLVFIGDNPETDFTVPHEKGAATLRFRKGINAERKCDVQIDGEFSDWADLIKYL
jgi:putative hydrolase of the HAD superfamily